MKETIVLPRPGASKKQSWKARRLSSAKLLFYLSLVFIGITVLLSFLLKSQIEEFRVYNARQTRTNNAFGMDMGDKMPGSIEVIEIKAQPVRTNDNLLSLRLNTVNAHVLAFVPARDLLSFGTCANASTHTDNTVCVDIAKTSPFNSGEIVGELTVRWGNAGTASITSADGNSYANTNSLIAAANINTIVTVMGELPQTGSGGGISLNIWLIAGGVAFIFVLVLLITTLKGRANMSQAQLDKQWRLLALALLCSFALLIMGAEQSRLAGIFNLPQTGDGLCDTLVDPPLPNTRYCDPTMGTATSHTNSFMCVIQGDGSYLTTDTVYCPEICNSSGCVLEPGNCNDYLKAADGLTTRFLGAGFYCYDKWYLECDNGGTILTKTEKQSSDECLNTCAEESNCQETYPYDPLENTPTPTDTATVTPTETVTVTPTETITVTPTETVTVTPTETVTVTPTETLTVTPTETVTITPTETVTVTPTETVTVTPTETITVTPTETITVTPTETVTVTPTEPPAGTVVCGLIDVNSDNILDAIDLAAFALVYNKSCSDTAPASGCGGKDTNGDAKVNFIDLASFATRYHSVANSCL